MVIDVFIRTTPNKSPLRQGFFMSTFARWHMEPLARITVIEDHNGKIREHRLWAESRAQSEIYIVTDDDVLPHGKNWLARGFAAMQKHPEYVVCSTLSLVEGENLATGEGEIYPMHAVGAPMWIRRGILGNDLPEFAFTHECGAIDDYVKAKGFQEGLINGLRHIHIGHGMSQDLQMVWGF